MTESNADLFAENRTLREQVVQLRAAVTEYGEQQKATAEILRIISSSSTDAQPVFDAIAKSGVRLFQGVSVGLRLVKGDRLERAAFAIGQSSQIVEDFLRMSLPLDDRGLAGRAVLHRKVVHTHDVLSEDWYSPETRKLAERMGLRSGAAAPMLREGMALGGDWCATCSSARPTS